MSHRPGAYSIAAMNVVPSPHPKHRQINMITSDAHEEHRALSFELWDSNRDFGDLSELDCEFCATISWQTRHEVQASGVVDRRKTMYQWYQWYQWCAWSGVESVSLLSVLCGKAW